MINSFSSDAEILEWIRSSQPNVIAEDIKDLDILLTNIARNLFVFPENHQTVKDDFVSLAKIILLNNLVPTTKAEDKKTVWLDDAGSEEFWELPHEIRMGIFQAFKCGNYSVDGDTIIVSNLTQTDFMFTFRKISESERWIRVVYIGSAN